MPNPAVITVTNGSLKLADTQAGLATGTAFECQVTTCSLEASANTAEVPATFCSPTFSTAGLSSFAMSISWIQDWRAAAGGLSGYAYTHDAQVKWFELKLDKTDTTPVATGQVTVVAGAFGGEAGSPLVTSTSWPVVGKPTITLPVTLEADEAEAEAEPEPVG